MDSSTDVVVGTLGEETDRMPGEYGRDGEDWPSWVEEMDGRLESS